ncbi:probable cytochrome P450 28d1 [Stomoxys calcitrans]|uniref:Cytochrome P450 n=1 Tax=Stomoxys calcitrans TaxID=35570 RepID=A0A1I8NNE6_STOCA|nr:probable cytochrome P450 28d1 [Stomoxys calcitrans]
MIVFILSTICVILLLLYLFLVWSFDYWKKRGVSGPKPWPFVGNYPSLATQKRNMACDIQDIYESYKHSENFVGIFNGGTPQLLLTDIDIIKRVLITDFKNFHDNDISKYVDVSSDKIFGSNPFILTGEEWKERRAEVTPGLTTNRIKTVYPVTNRVCKTMVDYIEKQAKMGGKDGVDGKDLCLRFTCEVVTDCVLGLNAETFTDKPSIILAMTNKLFQQSYIIIIYMVLAGIFPSIHKIKKLRFVPKNVETFFFELLQTALSMRRAQKKQGLNEERVDFVNYMLHLQEKKNLQIPELTAHTMTFLLDGFETTSMVLSHCLLLLGRDSSRQEMLRTEIVEKLGNSNDFDALGELPYLDACVHESLRIFSPAGFLTKMCTVSTNLENKNGKILNVAVGTPIIIPVQAIMMDERYYKNPNSFEPERFLNGGLKNYKDRGVFLGFGDGPRICLGMRFALTQIKAALAEIIRHYKVRINPRTRSDNKYDPTYFMLRLDGGVWLEFDKLN